MMFDMDPAVARLFYKENVPTAEEQTKQSGIGDLVPGAVIDAFAFEPCGYSMNAIAYGNYSTVHITPESECSYASFETNTPLKSYDSLINNVLRVFRPKRFVVTMFADEGALADMNGATPFEKPIAHIPGLGTYTRSSTSSTTFEKDYRCFMGTWMMDEGTTIPRLPPTRQRRMSVA